MDSIEQLKEKLDCEENQILTEVDKLLLYERWVENEMPSICEDNEAMRKALKESIKDFLA